MKNIYLFLGVIPFLFSGCSHHSSEPPAQVIEGLNKTIYHVVKSGETLQTIATKYGVSKDDIIKANSLKSPYKVFVRQRIKIKKQKVVAKVVEQPYYGSSDDLVVKKIELSPAEPLSVTNVSESTHEGAPDALPQPVAPETPEVVEKSPSGFAALPVLEAPVTSGYVWPVQGKVTQKFGQKAVDGTVQENITIQAPVGTKVKSIFDGKVMSAGKLRELQEWGNIVIVKNKDNFLVIYGFLKEVYVKKGQQLTAGQCLGTVGLNRATQKPMLLLQMRAVKNKKAGVPVDPLNFLIQ